MASTLETEPASDRSAVPAGGLPVGFHRATTYFVAAGLAACVGYLLLPRGLFADAVYVAIGLAGVVAIVAGVRINRPVRTRAWYLMAVGQATWVIGDIVLSWDSDVLGNDRFPSPADPFYLLAYPVLTAGLLLLAQGRRRWGDRSGLLDTLIVTVGLGLLSWVLLARPTAESYREDSAAAAAVALAYPVGDILLLAMLILFLTTPGAWTRSLRLLLAAVALLIAADTASLALDLVTFDSSKPLDILWLTSYVFWGAAALHPSMYALSKPGETLPVRFTRARLAALTLAVLIAPATLAVQQLLGLPLDVWAVVIGSVLTFVLVVARMNLSIDQILAANRQREQLQEDLAHQAAHDSLTGLPNRAQAMRLIQGALSRAQRSGAIIGLLFIDLDGFKRVNDTLGHAAGDEVLREAAQRMVRSVRGGDTVARLGGDEFVVLLEPLDEQASAVSVADRLMAEVSSPIPLASGRSVRVGASIGVALSQDGTTDPDLLLNEADVAVYRAKAGGRGRTEIFDAGLRREVNERTTLESAIASAIRNDELVLHYQPIVNVQTGGTEGYEALVRWNRPGVGLVAPADFIPVAEQSDLICDVDAWVLSRATAQLATWNAERGDRDLTMAVNVSGRHVTRMRILDDVLAALNAAEVLPWQLVLEITETALIDDPQALVNLSELRRMGISISIDDFGTGYSSIMRLETLPVDCVKVDRRFLDPESESALKLLQLIVQAAHAFGLPVVAEGVERDDQLRVLRDIDCESAQGFLFGRPSEAERWPLTRRPRIADTGPVVT
jgi:diguanylate cyclase (GGDEF)-like protein